MPGNKNGWSDEGVYNSVGFAGAGERYTLAMMSMDTDDETGIETLNQVAALLFAAPMTPEQTYSELATSK